MDDQDILIALSLSEREVENDFSIFSFKHNCCFLRNVKDYSISFSKNK